MAARVFSQQLDRSKPLWELWLVQGLTRNRFALVTKTHHALVDGVSGVDIATVLFDLKPVPEPVEPDHDWSPQPEPSSARCSRRASRTLRGRRCGRPGALERAVQHPESGGQAGRGGGRGGRRGGLELRQPRARGAR